MKKLKIVFDLEDIKIANNEKGDEIPIQEITYNVIRNIVLNYSQKNRGLNEEERRKYYKICEVFEKILKALGSEKLEYDKSYYDEVKLEDDWFGFIKKCKRETMNPDKVLQKVEELIDSVEYR